MSWLSTAQFKEKIVNTLPLQVLLFSIVGFTCFLIDTSFLILFIDFLKWPVVFATAIAFILANIVNYFLSISIVFLNGKFAPKFEVGGFFLLAFIGLLFNMFFMYLFVDVLNYSYLITKVACSFLLMGFNFYTRKKILFIK